MEVSFIRSVPYTEMPFKIRGVLYTDVSWCSLYRGTQHTEVPYIPKFPLYRGAHCTEVPSIRRCPLYRGVPYTEVQGFLFYQKCPLYGGVLYFKCPLYRGFIQSVLIRGVTVYQSPFTCTYVFGMYIYVQGQRACMCTCFFSIYT